MMFSKREVMTIQYCLQRRIKDLKAKKDDDFLHQTHKEDVDARILECKNVLDKLFYMKEQDKKGGRIL